MPCSGLENGHFRRKRGSGDESCATDEASAQVVDDVTVEVGHHHDVELLRLRGQLEAVSKDDYSVVKEVSI